MYFAGWFNVEKQAVSEEERIETTKQNSFLFHISTTRVTRVRPTLRKRSLMLVLLVILPLVTIPPLSIPMSLAHSYSARTMQETTHYDTTTTTTTTTNITSAVRFDVQANLLNFLAQESVAHAALVFATLSAAFAFASVRSNAAGVRKRKWSSREMQVFGVVTFLLILVAIYALFRFMFYAALSDYALNHPSPLVAQTLSEYWGNVTQKVQLYRLYILPFTGLYEVGMFGLFISSFLAYLFSLLVTLLVTGSLSGLSASLHPTYWLIIAVCVFSEVVPSIVFEGSWRPYSIWAGLPLFFVCIIIQTRFQERIRRLVHRQGFPRYRTGKRRKSLHMRIIGWTNWSKLHFLLTLGFLVIAMLPVLAFYFYHSNLLLGFLCGYKFDLLFGDVCGYSPLTVLLSLNIFYPLYGLWRELRLIARDLDQPRLSNG